MDLSFSKPQELVMDRETSCAPVHGVAKSWIWLSDWIELNWMTPWHMSTPAASLNRIFYKSKVWPFCINSTSGKSASSFLALPQFEKIYVTRKQAFLALLWCKLMKIFSRTTMTQRALPSVHSKYVAELNCSCYFKLLRDKCTLKNLPERSE